MQGEPIWAPITQIHLGLEIEVPWSSYFPEAQREWFVRDGSTRAYKDFSPSELREFDIYCSVLDSRKLPELQRIAHELWLTRGADRYFEWVFPPIRSVVEICSIISRLRAYWALPKWGKYSLQITLGELSPCPDLGIFMTALELLAGVGSERIMSALHMSSPSYPSGWARKWVAGYRERSHEEILMGDTCALEVRTLLLPEDPEILLQLASIYGTELANTGSLSGEWVDFLRQELLLIWLSVDRSTWGNPVTHPDIWRRYAVFLEKRRSIILDFLEKSILYYRRPK